MTKAEELRTGRSDAMRKLSRRYAAAEQLPPTPPVAHDLDSEANHTAWPVEVDPVDDRGQSQDLLETGNDDDDAECTA